MQTQTTKRQLGMRRTVAGLSLICLAILLLVIFQWHAATIQNWMDGIHAGWLMLALATLPLVCFPVSVLYLLVGAKLGFGVGLLVATTCIGLNLVAGHWIASKFLRGRLDWLLTRSRYRLPVLQDGQHVSVALLTALLPGPYGLKNYLLALSGVPLKVYFLVCAPVYVLRASSGILFGEFSGQMTWGRGLCFAAYALVIGYLCRMVVKKWRTEPSPVTA